MSPETYVRYQNLETMTHEFLASVNMSMFVFWAVTPCELKGTYQRFGG